MKKLDELAKQMAEATVAGLRRLTDPITQRVSTLETRVGAMSMMRGNRDEEALRMIETFNARLKALEEAQKERG